MDNLRLILVFSLAFILLLLWQAWNQDYVPKPPVDSVSPSTETVPSAVTKQVPKTQGEVPTAPSISADGAYPQTGVTSVPSVADTDQRSPSVEVMTDLYQIEIDTQGGTIRKLYLNDYPVTLDNPNEKFQLLRPTLPDLYLAQSGLIGMTKN